MAIVSKVRVRDPLAKALLMAMANYADEECRCWPSQERLAEDTGMSRRSVIRKVEWLSKAGYLSVTVKRDGKSFRNYYQIHGDTESQSNEVHSDTKAPSEVFTVTHSPFHSDTQSQEPVIEPTNSLTAREREADDGLIECKKQITRIYAAQGFQQFPDTGYCELWKARGYDLRLCVAAIGSWMERNKRFVTLKYHDGMLADWHAKPPEGRPQARAGPVTQPRKDTMLDGVRRHFERKAHDRPDETTIDAVAIRTG